MAVGREMQAKRGKCRIAQAITGNCIRLQAINPMYKTFMSSRDAYYDT